MQGLLFFTEIAICLPPGAKYTTPGCNYSPSTPTFILMGHTSSKLLTKE